MGTPRLIGVGGGGIAGNDSRDRQTIGEKSTISNHSFKLSDNHARADPRVEKTRHAINSAFSHLMFTREFDLIRIDDILATAKVARSTFYQHYRGKDDVLCAVMGAHILEPLARAGLYGAPSPELLQVAHHVWQNRPLARQIFWGSTRTAIVRNLAVQIEQVLGEVEPMSGLPLSYVASTVAHWQIAMLEEWLLGRHRFEPAQWAQALCRGTRSLTAALTGTEVAGT